MTNPGNNLIPFRRRGNSGARSSNPDFAVIEYDPAVHSPQEFIEAISAVLVDSSLFFDRDSALVHLNGDAKLIPLDSRTMNGVLSGYLEVHYGTVGKAGDFIAKKRGMLPGNLVGTVLHSPILMNRLPKLVSHLSCPAYDKKWNLVASPGFHRASGLLYTDETVEPRDGTELLDQVLADFPWQSEADRTNFLGILLTAVTMPRWIRGHPMVVFNGNRPGVGKTLAAKLLGVTMDGRSPVTISYTPYDEEFERQLATRVRAGDQAIIIDNVKLRHRVPEISSPVLERCVTDETLNFRLLGRNASITRKNDLIFCLTMNGARLSEDLRRRCVPINLEVVDEIQKRAFAIPDLLQYARANRLAILGELLGMVDRWLKAGKPQPARTARHSVNGEWAATIDAILSHSGFTDFLTNYNELESAFDPDFAVLEKIAEKYIGQPAMTATQWAGNLAGNLLGERLQGISSTRARATLVGTLFGRYIGREFTTTTGKCTFVRLGSESSHVSKHYRFALAEPLDDGPLEAEGTTVVSPEPEHGVPSQTGRAAPPNSGDDGVTST